MQIVTTEGTLDLQTFPRSYQGLTLNHYQNLFDWDGKEHIKLFSILSGLPITHIRASKSAKLETKLLNSVRFMYEQTFEWPTDLPEFIVVRGIAVKVPKNIGRLSLGQNIEARIQIAQRCKKDLRQAMSVLLAIYLQPFVCGRERKNESEYIFHLEDALELERDILELPAVLVYALGFFLLMNVNGSGKTFQNVLKKWKRNIINNAEKMQRQQTWIGWPRFLTFP